MSRQQSILSIFFFLVFSLVLGLLVFSERGILEMRELGAQMDRTRANIHRLEESNKDFRRQLDLLKGPEAEKIVEHQARQRYSWVHEDEMIYLRSKSDSPF